MILDAVLGVFLSLVLVLVSLLPANTDVGLPSLTAGFGDALAMARLLDAGLPVHEAFTAAAGFLAASLVVDGYVVVRSVARWLPSWLTGGG